MYPDGPLAPERGFGPEPETLDLNRPEAYGRAFADVYDRWYGDGAPNGTDDRYAIAYQPDDDLAAMARFVADRTPSGLVIELGVGSGRLAQPLVKRGLTVIGIDASRAMLSGCRPGVLRIEADMVDPPIGPVPEGTTVLCGFNTLFNVGCRDRLGRLLGWMARSGCRFIIEMFNIALLDEPVVSSTGLSSIDADAGLVVSTVSTDRSRRMMVGRHLEINDAGVTSRPWRLHLVDLRELDTVAAQHGLEPTERYGSWRLEPLSSASESIVAVYRYRPGAGLKPVGNRRSRTP